VASVLDALNAELLIAGDSYCPEGLVTTESRKRPMDRFDRSGSSACRAATTAVFAGVSEADDDRDLIQGHHDHFVYPRRQAGRSIPPATRESSSHGGFRRLKWRDPDSNRDTTIFSRAVVVSESQRFTGILGRSRLAACLRIFPDFAAVCRALRPMAVALGLFGRRPASRARRAFRGRIGGSLPVDLRHRHGGFADVSWWICREQ
jgi:hypothetical protein